MEQETHLITVTGKVQGVFYRQSTREKALALQLTGTVQNQPDGSVRIVATGSPDQLQALENWCAQGPPRASVTGVDVIPTALQPFEEFKIVNGE